MTRPALIEVVITKSGYAGKFEDESNLFCGEWDYEVGQKWVDESRSACGDGESEKSILETAVAMQHTHWFFESNPEAPKTICFIAKLVPKQR